jgi:hypothetical protein
MIVVMTNRPYLRTGCHMFEHQDGGRLQHGHQLGVVVYVVMWSIHVRRLDDTLVGRYWRVVH